MTDQLFKLDALAQADLVRGGKVTPVELVDAAIARIERLNPKLNAVIIPLFDKARNLAASGEIPNGPFRGVPMLLKDLICQSAGDPYHGGSRLLRDAGWTASEDSFLAARYRAAGFIFVGRTNVPEFGPMPTTEPEVYGPTHNPWDTDRSPGGSSGGSAAAVASGMVSVAHGNDGGGSIRIPSSECGLVGLKPSRGRNSLGPEFGELWGGLVAEHVLTRSVRDTAAILDVTAGPMPGDPYFATPPERPYAAEVGVEPGRLRIGLLTRAPANSLEVHADCVSAARDAAHLLESLGHHIEETHPAALEDAEFGLRFGTVVSTWVNRELNYWGEKLGRPVTAEDVEPLTWALAEMGQPISADQYVQTITWLHGFSRRISSWWENGFDVLLTPTLAEPPPRLGEFAAPPEDPLGGLLRSLPIAAFTSAFNVTGQPAVSLPLYWNDESLPIGTQLIAAPGREDILIQVASQLEAARPWADRWPPVV